MLDICTVTEHTTPTSTPGNGLHHKTSTPTPPPTCKGGPLHCLVHFWGCYMDLKGYKGGHRRQLMNLFSFKHEKYSEKVLCSQGCVVANERRTFLF